MARRNIFLLDIYIRSCSIRRARAQYSSVPRRYTVIRYRIDRLDSYRRWTDVHEKVMEITTMWGSLRLAPIMSVMVEQIPYGKSRIKYIIIVALDR